MTEALETDWASLAIVCPHCGNRGEPGGEWEKNTWAPFRLIEEVVRTFPFSASISDGGVLVIAGDASNDEVDWESGANLRFECEQCYGNFPLPEKVEIDFE